ncbi:hypothetical protein AVEN_70906-1 [Araneus ventricosus]|uniref:ER-bound oxygenase mpaB/mpaB'/Rubber oxygenase catalytic domain-containing protein n=1 Tax=Araneus ventricosus TaxID=182803 RepID=A0A4Y2TU51_ARAVE|nr:hypothetical protein AVEN_70906-1 [Araneus ventricosus]
MNIVVGYAFAVMPSMEIDAYQSCQEDGFSKRWRRLYISVGYGSESVVFCWTILLFPSLVGLHGWTNDDYDAILHFWRTIGYLLGIEDKFNLCHGSYNQVVTSCEKLLHKDYKPVVEKADPISVAMAKNVTEAISMVEPLYTWPALATYIYELVGLPCPVDMCIIDKFYYNLIHFMMTYLIKFHRVSTCVNKLTRWKINSVERKDLQLMEK